MSDERKNRENDQLVTDVYKAMASERAPDHLNQQVLRLAEREGRTRYSRARAWIRPMAWAATIGLSFAFVLELSRLPSIEDDSVGIAVPTTPAVARPDRVSKPDRSSKIDDAPADRSSTESVLTESVSAAEVAAEGSAPDTFSAAASYAEAIGKKAPMSDPACPLEVRESAESWWVCIKTLRDNGQEDLADSEYEAFRQIFPDFVDSRADR